MKWRSTRKEEGSKYRKKTHNKPDRKKVKDEMLITILIIF